MSKWIGLILVLGILAGGFTLTGCQGKKSGKTEMAKGQKWTCPMHPQIVRDKPGRCPICGMDLVPVKADSGKAQPMKMKMDTAAVSQLVRFSDEAAALADVQTSVATACQAPAKEVRLYGTVQPDEQLLRAQVAHVNGRIERLAVDYTGQAVRRGQVIASVYSPDLQNAQQELLEAKKLASTQPALLRAAREKLRQWKLSDSQIDRLEAGGDLPDVDIRADASGVVTQRKVAQGDYVKPGSPLFDLADLSSVWVVFDAYEQDLPFLKKGETVNYQLESLPGKTFSGKIVFIDPLLDPATRTAKLRVESRNPGMQLKPGMYAEATVKATLPNAAEQVLVPRTAVLWTGKRSLVYVKQDASAALAFLPREVELGPQMGEDYVILAGLRPGEEVVTRGAFAVDASAQLEGKRSMMDEK